MEFLLLGVALATIAVIPAYIAQGKGYSFWEWYIFAFLLWIIAFIAILCMPVTEKGIAARQINDGNVKCPSCAEWIKSEAKVCRYCGRDV